MQCSPTFTGYLSFCLGSVLFVLLLLTEGFGSGGLFHDSMSGGAVAILESEFELG